MKRFLAAFNTTAARLSALYLILFSACAVILVFYMTGSAARFLVNETREAIAEEVQDLGGVYQRNGLRVLVRDIDRRSRRPGANLYMIADNTGRYLAGNVIALQPGVLDT
ncbi:MAG: two-component sensor histidine kinase, partial [Oricola sp.]|nr:two-component sensor histidine kinase [Oricola sp.]